jgi:uncharacterized protein
MGRAAARLVHLYRRGISPWLGNNCRFYPSCSEYAETAFLTKRFVPAAAAAAARLLKCQPFHPGGFDPVE